MSHNESLSESQNEIQSEKHGEFLSESEIQRI